MHILTPIPIGDIVLAVVDPGLPQAYWPNFVEDWKQSSPRMTWDNYFQSLDPNYQDKARQDKQEYRTNAATPNSPAEIASPDAAAVPGAGNEQQMLPGMGNPAVDPATAQEGTPQPKSQMINQLEQQYHETWNSFSKNVLPNLSNNVQQANALQALFNEVRPVWKALRQRVAQDPQFAETLDDAHIQGASASLGQASQVLQQLMQSDALIDNHIGNFQSQLTKAFNAIKQLTGGLGVTAPADEQIPDAANAAAQPVTEPTGDARWMGDMVQNVGQGVGALQAAPGRVKNWLGRGKNWVTQNFEQGRQRATASSNRFILTANMGSAHQLITKSHTRSQ